MSLRTRLIVAFLVVSVVPLAAVTYFSYTSQVRALQDLATREADSLSTEMTQRMQLVTTELSTRVEQLAEMQEPAVVRVVQRTDDTPQQTVGDLTTGTPSVVVPEAPVPVVAQAQPTTQASEQARVAEALGAAAMFLQSVELQGMRRQPPPRQPDAALVEGGRGDGSRSVGGRTGGERGESIPGRGRGQRPPLPLGAVGASTTDPASVTPPAEPMPPPSIGPATTSGETGTEVARAFSIRT